MTAEPASDPRRVSAGARGPARCATTATCAARHRLPALDTSKPLDFALLATWRRGRGGSEEPMSFLYPAFLLGGLAIAIPIVLHLLRRDVAPEVPFTAVRLLHKSPIERARPPAAAGSAVAGGARRGAALLAAAFARPYVRAPAPAPVRVVAIDRSFSMGAPGVFASGAELARVRRSPTPRGRASRRHRLRRPRRSPRAGLAAHADARAALDGLAAGVWRDAIRASLSAGDRSRRPARRTASSS